MSQVIKTVILILVFVSIGVFSRAQTTVARADGLTEKLDQTKAEVDRFKTAWDKARLETTLYEQRSKRAYQKWVKAAKTAKAKAQAARDKADIELQLSVEKRKLAFSQWHSAQLKEALVETNIKAVVQDQDTKAIQDKIRQLETELGPAKTPVVSSKP